MPADSASPPLIWCLGMYASGSTWLFNTTRGVAGALHPDVKIAGLYAESMSTLKKLPKALAIVKTHHLPPKEAQFMEERAGRILLSLRDPRDAVTSLMQHMGQSFAHALHWAGQSASFCARHAGDSRTELFVYEQGFTEQEATLDRLAAALGGALDSPSRERLYAETRRGAIEEKIARLESLPTVHHNPNGDVLDTDTQWHRHHAGRDGEIGRWRRMLTAEQIRAVEQHLGGFMQAFGYKRDATGIHV